MLTSKYLILINKLSSATNNGTIQWSSTSKPDTFQASVGGFTILVSYFTHMVATPTLELGGYSNFCSIALIKEDGTVVDEQKVCDDDKSDYSLLRNLVEKARMAVFKVDQTIDQIIASL